MGPAIDPLLVNNYPRWLEKAYAIFREMVRAGNEIAQFRWSELRQLEETMNCFSQDQVESSASNSLSQPTFAISHLLSPVTSRITTPMDQSSCNDRHPIAETPLAAECVFGPMLTSAEMMAMADSIKLYDAEWVSNAMMHHNIW